MRLIRPDENSNKSYHPIIEDPFMFAQIRVMQSIKNSCEIADIIFNDKLAKMRNDYRAFPLQLPIKKAVHYSQVVSEIEQIPGVINAFISVPEDTLEIYVMFKPQINSFISTLVEKDIDDVIKYCIPEDIKYKLICNNYATSN